MARKKAKLYKERGVRRQKNLTLTQEIANATYEKVLRGEKLYNKSGLIELLVYKGTGVEVVKIPCSTYNSWISRGQMIKGTDVMLRDTIDEARSKRVAMKRDARRQAMLDDAEKNLHRIAKMRTSEAVMKTRKINGKYKAELVYNPDGTPMRRVVPKLVASQLKATEYITSTLANETYNKLEKKETKNLNFSLSDLRKEQEKGNML